MWVKVGSREARKDLRRRWRGSVILQ